jgi:PKD repeat protein
MYGGAIQGLKVYARKSGGSDTLIANFNGQQSTSSNSFAWLKKTCTLSSFQGDTVIVSFEAYKNTGSNIFYTAASAIAIDDIAFEGTSTCPAPSLLSASNIGTNTAEISWQGTSNVSIVEYDTVGFALGTGQMINPASSPYTLTGLQPNTTYAVFVKDSCAANLVSSNATINFTTSPCPSVTAQGTTTLNGTIVTALNTGSLNDSILWNWGDGNSSIGNSVSYSYSTPGIYSVQQIAYNDCGNSDTLSTTLTICGAVAANFGFSGQGSTRLFSSNTSVGVALSYAWNFGDGSSSTSANPSHTYVSAGPYTVTLTVTDACGTVDVTTSAIDICQTVIPNFTNTFSGSTFTFTAQPAGLSNYDWNFGDGSTGSGLNVTHTYSSIGTYYVTLNCTDTCGGSYSVLDTVSTCPALNANFNFNIASSGSNGMLVQFFANVSGSLGLIWDWGDGSQTVTQAASISHQYATVNLNYTITLKAYNECGDTVEVMKSLNEVGLPEQSTLKYKTYPNPVSGSLTIEFTRPLNGTYYLYDVTGRLVRGERFAESAFVIFSTSDLSKGSYILKVESDQRVKNSIIFKQ